MRTQSNSHGASGQEPNCVVRRNSPKEEVSTFSLAPTLESAVELQFAYDHFNRELFAGSLPDCVIVYTRKKRVLGHFSPDRFQRVDGELRPELALNPIYLAVRQDRESLSTLVHEPVHVQRHYFGPLNRKGSRGSSGYHDKVWADLMDQIGLIPSDTALPGGKRTGMRMSHYIAPGGPFDIACAALLARGFRLSWRDSLQSAPRTQSLGGSPDGKPKASGKKDRIKVVCPNTACSLQAWVRPTGKLVCGFCNLAMVAASAPTISCLQTRRSN